MLALTRRPNGGFRLYWNGEFIGTLAVRPGLYPGETKCLFDCDPRLQIQREELPPRPTNPPPTHPVRESFDDYLDDADDFDADRRREARGGASPSRDGEPRSV